MRACGRRLTRHGWCRLPQAWRQGLTGYPLVDAGMRQLWSTGWMHNRIRVLCASFLVKNLLLPWQARPPGPLPSTLHAAACALLSPDMHDLEIVGICGVHAEHGRLLCMHNGAGACGMLLDISSRA